MPRRFLVFSFVVGLALTASAVVPSVEKILPDDTLLMMTTPDYAKLRDIYRSSPQTQLWDDPAMKPFKEKFLSKLTEDLIQPLEKDLGIKFADYTNLPQGQITFAITQNGWPMTENSRAGILFLLDTKDKNAQLTKNLADLRKKWVDAGKTLRTEKIRNVEFSVLPISDKDIPKTLRKFAGADRETDTEETSTNAPKNEIYIGQYESLLVVGTAAKPIEKVLVHMTGGEMPSLGDLAVYDANRLALFRDAPFYGWANTKSLMDLFNRKQAKEDTDTPDPFAMLNPTRILTALGVSSLRTLAFSVQVANDGSTVQVFGSMPASSRQGIFAMLPEAKDSTPPSFVPADAVKFQRWRVDGQKAWTTLQKVMNDISPQAKQAISFMIDTANAAAKEKDPDFDMNKNFFGNLGDDMITYEKAPHGTTLAELSAAPSLFLLGSPNPDKIVAAFKYLLMLANPQGASPKEREFLGRKIYTAPLPGAAMGGANLSGATPPARTLTYAASTTYVAISTDAAMVEEYLRSSDSQKKTLRETPGLTEAIAKAGGSSTGLFGYENQAETTRAVFEAMRTSSSTNSTPNTTAMMLGLGGLPSTGSLKEWMDFSLLPPFDKISKYFGFSVYTLGSNPDGLLFKMYAPVPAGVRK
jgi:hypothetical protein